MIEIMSHLYRFGRYVKFRFFRRIKIGKKKWFWNISTPTDFNILLNAPSFPLK